MKDSLNAESTRMIDDARGRQTISSTNSSSVVSQGWLSASVEVNRLVGSISRSFERRSLASDVIGLNRVLCGEMKNKVRHSTSEYC